MAEFLFYPIALSTCVFAILTVTSGDIFHSAVWLAMTLLSIAAVYFYLSAEFLGVIQILVYVGGIITLFVFAIKLTARIGDKTIQQVNQQVVLSAITVLVFLFFLFRIIAVNPWAPVNPQAAAFSLKQIGESLLTVYLLPFEFMSLILLGAMVGAIIIGKVKR
jgi:NADH:ubiquinone oxidoreductase subunit 6 (subunit J)